MMQAYKFSDMALKIVEKAESNARWQDRYFSEDDNFFGCINPEGHWCDSSDNFEPCITWCRYDAGNFDEMSRQEELHWLNTTGRVLGYSIVHGTLLKKLFINKLVD